MRRMTTEKEAKVLQAMELTNDTNMTIGTNLTVDGNVEAPNLHLYALTLYYSDLCFTVYTKSTGVFEVGTEYELCSKLDISLTTEQTTSLMEVLSEIEVGQYDGIPFVMTNGNDFNVYVNKSDSNELWFQKTNGDDYLDIILGNNPSVGANEEQDDWYIKFTQLI